MAGCWQAGGAGVSAGSIIWLSVMTCAVLYGLLLVLLAACWLAELHKQRAEAQHAAVKRSQERRSVTTGTRGRV